MASTKFHAYGFQPFILEAIEKMGFYEPTEIQKILIPIILNGESAVGQSQTGTGKTHAYLLPILEKIKPEVQEVQAVITAPTRELAMQIYQEILKITGHKPKEEGEIVTRLFIGGTDKQKDMDKLKRQPHLVVGTPARIFDLIHDQVLFVHTSSVLVVDEADLMIDLGLIEDVDRVASRMPKELQMLVFSATIPEILKPFLKKYMENPRFVQVKPKQAAPEKIDHYLIPLRHRDKLELLCDILACIQPFIAIIFVNTKATAGELAEQLALKGIKAGEIHGDLTPRERKKMLKQIRNLEYQYIVATDLAARGIHIDGVSHVINYEVPKDLDFFIHRVGRTGRAGQAGTSITIYEPQDEQALNKLEKKGIAFIHADVQKGEIARIDERKRKSKEAELEQLVKKQLKKAKKVKPGYKKKLKMELEQRMKREKRLKR